MSEESELHTWHCDQCGQTGSTGRPTRKDAAKDAQDHFAMHFAEALADSRQRKTRTTIGRVRVVPVEKSANRLPL